MAQRETAAIIAPVPLIVGLTLAVGCALDQLYWIGLTGSIPRPYRATLAIALMALGGWFLWLGIAHFRRRGTDFNPYKPTKLLVTDSIYARTRNPMYEGFILVTLGCAVLLRSDWTILLLVPAMALIHVGVVLREERFLRAKFGPAYDAYCAQVPRYSLPLAGARNSRHASP